jgi:hypothetical protein
MKTVYVIGAGASAEVGLPVGESLKKTISKFLNFKFEGSIANTLKSGNATIYDAIKLHTKDNAADDDEKSNIIRAGRLISDSLPLARSIDNFIDNHRDNEQIAFCGKLAIVYAILEAERNSELYFDEYKGNANINFERISTTWYVAFFKTLTENCHIDDLSERLKNITLIIFNYDRCVEHFLYNAFKIYYNCDDSKATQLLESIEIYHPYGSVGALPCLDKGSNSIQFGANIKLHNLLDLVQKIKTFTQGTDPKSSEINNIKNCIDWMDRIVFLGFAFLDLNMELITSEARKKLRIRTHTFATTYKFSNYNVKKINSQIASLISSTSSSSPPIQTSNATCAELFRDYSKGLSFK